MSGLLLSIALCVGSEGAAPVERPYHEIEREIGAALKREALAKSFEERAAEAAKLAALFDEIRRDRRLETSDYLPGYQSRIRGRLMKIKKELLRDAAREAAKQRKAGAESDLTQLPANADPAAAQLSLAFATQLDWFASAQGGPAKLISDGAQSRGANGATGGGAVPDSSAALIELIERTISPDHWDTNGGPGSIVYYQPLHVLVIRASSEVHGRVGGLVGGLRAAGP